MTDWACWRCCDEGVISFYLGDSGIRRVLCPTCGGFVYQRSMYPTHAAVLAELSATYQPTA